MPLIKNGRAIADPWTAVADEEELPAGDRPIIVSLTRWRAERDALIGRGGSLGVRLASNELASDIADDLQRFALVALDFPSFRDGRGYSSARLLRQRYGFRGEIRATGNVLRDQFLFLHRCGFDAFEIAKPGDADAWEEAIEEVNVYYQTAADRWAPAQVLRHLRIAAE
jgi:uncharacterized protein (DUF934 family)